MQALLIKFEFLRVEVGGKKGWQEWTFMLPAMCRRVAWEQCRSGHVTLSSDQRWGVHKS